MGEQAVYERGLSASAVGGVNGEAGGFIDDQQMLIFIHDIQRHLNGFQVTLCHLGHGNAIYIALCDLVLRVLDFGFILTDGTLANQRLQTRARQATNKLAERFVQPLASKLGGNSNGFIFHGVA